MREDTLTLLALDARLAGILREKGEVLLAQVKLAWWRDRLREEPADWPLGEPLLARLRGWGGQVAGLARLVDGWEELLADPLDDAAMRAFAEGRAAGWAALAEALSARGSRDQADNLKAIHRVARQWALADLALHLVTPAEATSARKLAFAQADKPPPLPRSLRPLAVLRGLAVRALERGSSEALDGPGAMFAALRIGLAGR